MCNNLLDSLCYVVHVIEKYRFVEWICYIFLTDTIMDKAFNRKSPAPFYTLIISGLDFNLFTKLEQFRC